MEMYAGISELTCIDRYAPKEAVYHNFLDIYKGIGDAAIDDEIALLEKYGARFQEKGNLVMVEYLAEAYVRKAGIDVTYADQYYDKALELFEQVEEGGWF